MARASDHGDGGNRARPKSRFASYQTGEGGLFRTFFPKTSFNLGFCSFRGHRDRVFQQVSQVSRTPSGWRHRQKLCCRTLDRRNVPSMSANDGVAFAGEQRCVVEPAIRIPVARAPGFLMRWRWRHAWRLVILIDWVAGRRAWRLVIRIDRVAGRRAWRPWRRAFRSCIQVIASMRAGRIRVVLGGGVHALRAGLWEQAKPGWRSAADRQ